MKKKYTILFSIISLMFCVGIFTFVVYATTQRFFNIKNDIVFNSSGIYVSVVGVVSGYDASRTINLEPYQGATDISLQNPRAELPAWNDEKLKSLYFANASTPIVFTFTVTNTGEVPFEVDITQFSALTSTKIECSILKRTSINQPVSNLILNKDEIGTIIFETRVKSATNYFSNEPNNFTLSFTA